jgi:hypothetical protein
LTYVSFFSLRRGYYTEKFFCSYVEILIQNAGKIFVNLMVYLLSDGCSCSVVDDVCFVCVGEVIIETELYINCCADDSTILLNFVEVRRCIFSFLLTFFLCFADRASQYDLSNSPT